MRRTGIEPIYCRTNTSRRHPEHAVFAYRLRGLAIDRPNQVWAADITHIPMARGVVYLVAILDRCTRKVLAWQLSNSLSSDFCVAALEEAIARYGVPEIFNADRGPQFTGADFIGRMQQHRIATSMDGKSCWRDNIFVERLWKTIKYEEVYLHAYETVSAARESLSRYIASYNSRRPHRALDGQSPDTVYFRSLPPAATA